MLFVCHFFYRTLRERPSRRSPRCTAEASEEEKEVWSKPDHEGNYASGVVSVQVSWQAFLREVTATQVILTLRVESVSVRAWEDGTLGWGFAPRQNQIFGRHLLAPNASFEEGRLKFFLISFFYLVCKWRSFCFYCIGEQRVLFRGVGRIWTSKLNTNVYPVLVVHAIGVFLVCFFGLDTDIWQQDFVGERDLATMCLFCAHLLDIWRCDGLASLNSTSIDWSRNISDTTRASFSETYCEVIAFGF